MLPSEQVGNAIYCESYVTLYVLWGLGTREWGDFLFASVWDNVVQYGIKW